MEKNYAVRRHFRNAKGWRRIKEDRQQHGQRTGPLAYSGFFTHDCPCFGDTDPRVWGRTFSRFADTPKVHSAPWCCGNPRCIGDTTLAEQRSDLDFKQQLEEVFEERLVNGKFD